MLMPSRLVPRSVTAQVAILVTAAVFLGDLLTSGFLVLFQGDAASPDHVASRIAVVTQLAQATRSPAELADMLATARRAGIEVRELPVAPSAASGVVGAGGTVGAGGANSVNTAGAAGASLTNARTADAANPENRTVFTRLIVAALKSRWNLNAAAVHANAGAGASASARENNIVMHTANGTALAFNPGVGDRALIKLATLTAAALLIASAFVALVAWYAVRWVTAPLSSIASAARAFGHSPAQIDALPERGPADIVQVARALNDMRARIRALIDERTRMLAAISHDLRTPLTRLRLRAERVSDVDTREGMLRDAALIDDLLGEALDFLREDARGEPTRRTDLPSLLQTVCAEFTDVGHAVSYEGPTRLACACRPRALARAIRNIVDNGVKHGSGVIVKLHAPSTEHAHPLQIEIRDDGPGIPAALRSAVFEPFFKGDEARTPAARGGFGLGLSIARDIIREHRGSVELLDGHPRGLTVRIALAGAPAETSLNEA